MILTIIESRFAPINGHEGLTDDEYKFAISDNIAYAKLAMRDCLNRMEAPYASHLLFTQDGLLDDRDPDQRRIGIEAGLIWGSKADQTAVYTDRGISKGMTQGIQRAKAEGRTIVYRSFPKGSESSVEV